MAHVEDTWYRKDPVTRKRVAKSRCGQGKRWRAVWTEPGGKRATMHFELKEEAAAYAARQETRKADGTYVSRSRGEVTVADYYAQWLLRRPPLAATTADTDETVMRVHVLPRWGQVSLRDLDHEEIQAWARQLPVGSDESRQRIIRPFSAMLNAAVKAKRIGSNPAAGLGLGKTGKRKQEFLTVTELDAMAEAMPAYWRPYLYFLAYTGLRQAEAAGLQVRDVDLAGCQIRVEREIVLVGGKKTAVDRVKTDGSERWVPLVRQVIPIIENAMAGKEPHDHLFTGPRGGTIDRNVFRRRFFAPAREVIGKPGLRPHDLRHTAVSFAIAAGATIKDVQNMAGHARASMTLDVYGHLLARGANQAAAKMSDWLDRERAGSAPSAGSAARRHERKAARRRAR